MATVMLRPIVERVAVRHHLATALGNDPVARLAICKSLGDVLRRGESFKLQASDDPVHFPSEGVDRRERLRVVGAGGFTIDDPTHATDFTFTVWGDPGSLGLMLRVGHPLGERPSQEMSQPAAQKIASKDPPSVSSLVLSSQRKTVHNVEGWRRTTRATGASLATAMDSRAEPLNGSVLNACQSG